MERVERQTEQKKIEWENAEQEILKAEQEQTEAEAAKASANASYRKRMIDEAFDTFYAYIYRFIDVINANDFSLISPILLNGSDIYNEQKKMVPCFSDQGITENVVSVKDRRL